MVVQLILFACSILCSASFDVKSGSHPGDEQVVSGIRNSTEQINEYQQNEEYSESLPLPPSEDEFSFVDLVELDGGYIPSTIHLNPTLINNNRSNNNAVVLGSNPRLSLLRFLVSEVSQSINLVAQTVESIVLPFHNEDDEGRTHEGQTTSKGSGVKDESKPDTSYVETNHRCHPPCPKRTLLVAYKYPQNIVNKMEGMSKHSPEKTPTSSVGRIRGMGRFVLQLLRDASKIDLLGLGMALSNSRHANSRVGESLDGLGVSEYLNSDILKDDDDAELLDNSDSREVAKLQRGNVVLRLLAQVKEEDQTANFVQRSLSEIEELSRITSSDTELTTTSTSTTTTSTTTTSTTTGAAVASAANPTFTTTAMTSRISMRQQPSDIERTAENIIHKPPFYTTYLSHLHMESLEAPTEAHATNYKNLLLRDPNVHAVYVDEVLSFDEGRELIDHNTSLSDEDADGRDDANFNVRREEEKGKREEEKLGNREFREGKREEEEQSPSGIERPNDKFYDQQWALTDPNTNPGGANVVDAWRIWSGANEDPITIALIDSGVDLKHRDLQKRLWKNQREICGNGIDDDRNGYVDDCEGWVGHEIVIRHVCGVG